MTKNYAWMLFILLVLFTSSSAFAKLPSADITSQGETTHFEVIGQKSWDYTLNKKKEGEKVYFEMTLPAVDEASISRLAKFKSPLIQNIEISKNGPDGKAVIKFFAISSQVDSFDYLTDEPSRLIVDFFPGGNADTTAAKTNGETSMTDTVKKAPTKKLKNSTNVKSEDIERKPSSADFLTIDPDAPSTAIGVATGGNRGLFDGGDETYERFTMKDHEIKEDAIIKSRENFYIPFPMLDNELAQWTKMKENPPTYEILPEDSDENKHARLLTTLFGNNRFNVFLKTADWFLKNYPDSKYKDMVMYMQGDVYYQLYVKDKNPRDYEMATIKYQDAIKSFPQSPLAERTSIFLGFLALDRGDSLGAIRLFNDHIVRKEYEKRMSKDLARLGMAAAFLKLNKFEDAMNEYDKVESQSPFKELKTEAAYRKGDVMIKKKDYAAAVDLYKRALKKFPEGQSEYPNAYFNQGEALFGGQKYREALDVFREFVRKFPTQSQAPYGMTRIGELLEILGADQTRVMGAYLETQFRYGDSPKAVIARLHALSTRMKNMGDKELEEAVKKIAELTKKSDLAQLDEFASIMMADGYTKRGNFQKAIDILQNYYVVNPSVQDNKHVTRRIISNINEKIRHEVNQGKFIQALQTHKKFSDNWLKKSSRIDTKYFLGQAFEQAGADKESENYYLDVLNRLYAVRGTSQAKEIEITQYVPSTEELNLRLAAVTANQGKANQAYEYLREIKHPEKLSEAKQIERIALAVKLLDHRGDSNSAIRYLTELLREWKGEPQLVSEPYLRLAELENKGGRIDDAIRSLEKIDTLQSDSKKVKEEVHAKALEMVGNLYLQKGNKEKAIAAYEKLLNTYESKRPLASLRYKLGDILFQKGEVQKASDVWEKIEGPQSEMWQKLAQEQLKNSEWRTDYKKYIKRIPAMYKDEKAEGRATQ